MSRGSLRSLLDLEYKSQSPIEWTSTMKYINLLGIAIGMEYLHSLKIVHRDLNPDNILLDENFYPHICHFGLSKMLNENLSQKVIESEAGTPAYMAPEIIKREDFTFKIDVYSFSIIAYELITGSCPIRETDLSQIKQNITKGKRPDLSKVPNKQIQFN